MYTFTLAAPAAVVADLHDTNYDSVLFLRSDCADPATEEACNDDFGDVGRSRIEAVLDAGTHFGFVGGWSGANGHGTLDLTVGPP